MIDKAEFQEALNKASEAIGSKYEDAMHIQSAWQRVVTSVINDLHNRVIELEKQVKELTAKP